MSRRWGIKIIDEGGYQSAIITLKKLQQTIKLLKNRGGLFEKNKWASPIVPLLIEHTFMGIDNGLGSVNSITLEITKGKDIKL